MNVGVCEWLFALKFIEIKFENVMNTREWQRRYIYIEDECKKERGGRRGLQ